MEFQVRWSTGDTTWEPAGVCMELIALDQYLEIHGERDICKLPGRKPINIKGKKT